jgi:hypothetical protein
MISPTLKLGFSLNLVGLFAFTLYILSHDTAMFKSSLVVQTLPTIELTESCTSLGKMACASNEYWGFCLSIGGTMKWFLGGICPSGMQCHDDGERIACVNVS